MVDYGVPTAAEGALPWSWAEERLIRTRNFWVATTTPTGAPHMMPVWGIWLPGNDRFMFSCSPNARKARNLRSNNRITVAIDSSVEVVVVEGQAATAKLKADDPMVVAYAEKYWTSAEEQRSGAEFMVSHQISIMTPRQAFAIIEREEEFSTKATRWRW